jgi:ribosome recycling factor
MNTDINTFKKKLDDVVLWLSREFTAIRTGRATVNLLDDVMVEAYGTRSPINQVASVNIEDAKSIRILSWDKSLVKSIESALTKANLGVSIMTDAEGVRVKFPDLTSETREMLVKQAYKRVEEAKISVRNERNEIIKALEKLEKEKAMSEDDLKRKKDEVQKLVDQTTRTLDEKGVLKEKEIRS